MEQSVAQWWSMASAFFSAPAALAHGSFHALLPLAGLLSLLAGVALAIRWREKQAAWLVLPAIVGALAPLALQLAFDILGWLGLGFALVLGFLGVALWIQLVASDATRRLPVYMIGLFILSFVAYCGVLSIVLIWGS
jgi:hypothetical protein